jgi:hypothetical protein
VERAYDVRTSAPIQLRAAQDAPARQGDAGAALSPLEQLSCDVLGQDTYADAASPAASFDAATGGSASALPHRATLEQSFGVELGGVAAHVGTPAARAGLHALGAEAAACDERIAFRDASPSLELAAHETAHIVQQRAGGGSGAPAGKVSSPTDDAEVRADAAAAAVVAGKPVPDVGTAAAGIHRFGAGEHRDMGDGGSLRYGRGALAGPRKVELADDYFLTYGQVTALAGDHFESLEQMRRFAANKGGGAESREEIEYALEWQLSEKGRTWSPAAKKAQEARYYKLASKNDIHFPNPKAGDGARSTADKADDVDVHQVLWFPPTETPPNAIAAYRMGHVKAINEALAAGKAGKPIDRAMFADAFASHYLTDSFSGGHIRTERTSINEYWNAKVPMFYPNFIGYLAEKIAKEMNEVGGYNIMTIDMLVTGPPLFDGAIDTVKEKIGGKGRLDFGGIVALAVHDYDNAFGVGATSEGQDVLLMGDGHAGEGDEKNLAIRAVRRSIEDIENAYALGQAGKTSADTLLGDDGLFGSERVIPSPAANAKGAHNPKVDWRKGDVLTLLSDFYFQRAVGKFAEEKAGEVQGVANDMGGAKKGALERAVISKLHDKMQAVNLVWDVINWTPDTGGGVFGHNTDDNAVDYYDMAAKIPGGVQSLTKVARVNLIQQLLSGIKVFADEEQRVWYILDVCPEADAKWVIQQVGWEKIADELEDELDDRFRAKFPKAVYGA